LFLHFLSREKKTKQKKTPVSRLILRVDDAAGALGKSPTLRRDQTRLRRVNSPSAFSARPVDARRRTKGKKTKRSQDGLASPLGGFTTER
jgi:hypothetical protein